MNSTNLFDTGNIADTIFVPNLQRTEQNIEQGVDFWIDQIKNHTVATRFMKVVCTTHLLCAHTGFWGLQILFPRQAVNTLKE
jgi:hypothetical protein